MFYLILSIIISIFSILGIWMAGSSSYTGWLICLLTEVLWFWLIIGTKQWGLMPAVVGYTVVYGRNFWLWYKKSKVVEA
jgi:hypothetical protein